MFVAKSGKAQIPVSNKSISTGYFISSDVPTISEGNTTVVSEISTMIRVTKKTAQDIGSDFCPIFSNLIS